MTRRKFLKQTGKAAVAIASAEAMLASAWAQTSSPATRVTIDANRVIAPIDRNIFGSFLEHLGRAIYEGVYDPGSKFADANGFRTDVLKEMKDLALPIVRYPGGNFVSRYNWLDGVGPKQDRPHVLDRAWNTMESNQFGTNEFITWARLVGTSSGWSSGSTRTATPCRSRGRSATTPVRTRNSAVTASTTGMQPCRSARTSPSRWH